jgi:hypothetical protein
MMTRTRQDLTEAIADAIADELDRQSHAGASRIDVGAMAAAIARRIGAAPEMPPRVQMRRAKRPDELNATNDI